MWQHLQYGDKTVCVRVYPGIEGNQEVPFVYVDDIQDHFPDATKFMCGSELVSFLRDASGNWLLPKRFAYRPDKLVQVVMTASTMSPRQLTRQSTMLLQSTSASSAEKGRFQQSIALFDDFIKAIQNGQKEHADVIRGDFQKSCASLQAALDRNHDLQQQLNNMQQHMLQMQQLTLDRLADMNGRVQALLTATYELHEYPIPRLFIVLPKDSSTWDPVSRPNTQFRLYFLCECGEHTKVLSGNNTNTPHHIHIAKHEGYDLQRPTEFFQKYGRYMLTLLEMIKYGVTIAGFAVPALAAVSAPGAIDMFHKSLDTISQSAVNQSIEYLQSLSSKDSMEQDPAKIDTTNPFHGREALEGADLRHLEAFIKSKDQHRALGNLYRTITKSGHVKWVCIGHYRLAYKENDHQAFTTEVELNGGQYDAHLGKTTVKLGSKIRAARFFDALAKASRVDELDVTFDWECTTSDLRAFGDTLKSAAISIVRLDLRQFRASLGSKLLSTSTRYELLARIVNLPNTKMIHLVLPMDSFQLSRLQSKTPSHHPKISVELVPGGKYTGKKEIEMLAETLKTNSTLTTLNLRSNSIGEYGAMALAEALKTNSALTTLELIGNSIGGNGAVALAEALKTNSTLTTLELIGNSIEENGAVALAEALKTNSTLTTLNLGSNSIGDNGTVALAEALKINSTLSTLTLGSNSIGDNGTVALAEALKTNSTLATLNLWNNSIEDNGA
ncbi:hypothetical protein BGX24_002642, partial [Mortierella sp. AD032]